VLVIGDGTTAIVSQPQAVRSALNFHRDREPDYGEGRAYATLLNDSTVLVTGGVDITGSVLATADLYE
jgi:hypothetical protein